MNSRWTDFLLSQGASIRDGAVSGFGDSARELAAAQSGSIVAPLSHIGLIEATGPDASAFLHAQLSSDVAALQPWRAQRSSYCSPKGRVLANFILWREPESFRLLLARDLSAAICKRLGMFVLRSRVKLEDASERCVVLGISGSNAHAALERSFGTVHSDELEVSNTAAGTIIGLGNARFVALLTADSAESTWKALSQSLTAAGDAAWRWQDIRAGTPLLSAATQDQFVPQMANLELVGAVNFRKGCYPGQEIVARTQYLGKLKRRLYRFHTESAAVPSAATGLFSAETAEQACGIVVDAVPAPGGGVDLLAVVQSDVVTSPSLRLGSGSGPELRILDLPYAIPLAA